MTWLSLDCIGVISSFIHPDNYVNLITCCKSIYHYMQENKIKSHASFTLFDSENTTIQIPSYVNYLFADFVRPMSTIILHDDLELLVVGAAKLHVKSSTAITIKTLVFVSENLYFDKEHNITVLKKEAFMYPSIGDLEVMFI